MSTISRFIKHKTCKYFKIGTCLKGKECSFVHSPSSTDEIKSDYVSKIDSSIEENNKHTSNKDKYLEYLFEEIIAKVGESIKSGLLHAIKISLYHSVLASIIDKRIVPIHSLKRTLKVEVLISIPEEHGMASKTIFMIKENEDGVDLMINLIRQLRKKFEILSTVFNHKIMRNEFFFTECENEILSGFSSLSVAINSLLFDGKLKLYKDNNSKGNHQIEEHSGDKLGKMFFMEHNSVFSINNDATKTIQLKLLCVICHEGDPIMACIPCGHKCLCKDCEKNTITSCPICRKEIRFKLRIFEL